MSITENTIKAAMAIHAEKNISKRGILVRRFLAGEKISAVELKVAKSNVTDEVRRTRELATKVARETGKAELEKRTADMKAASEALEKELAEKAKAREEKIRASIRALNEKGDS